MNVLKATVWGNAVSKWFLAIFVGIVAYIGLKVVWSVVSRQVFPLAKRSQVEWVDLLSDLLEKKTKSLFFIALALYAGFMVLTLPPRVGSIIRAAALVAVFFQLGVWGTESITWFSRRARQRAAEDPESLSTYSAIAFVGKLFFWSLLVMLALHNLGVNVTALVASLGIGGVAIALAMQNILGDLFASMAIILDKPFIIGDFIIVGDMMGTVEKIGLKTSRIRSLSGEQIVFSNNDLLSSRIRNFKRMWERRVVFAVGVTYQTPHEKLEAVPGMIREIIEAHDQARFDRAHFKSYGDFALIYEMVYFVKDPDYNVYMDTQQAINLEIYRRFEDEGIEFAYPTQTVYLERQSS